MGHVFTVVAFSQWPPARGTNLESVRVAEGDVDVAVDPQGCFEVSLRSGIGPGRRQRFQPVLIEPYCRLVLDYSWNASEIALCINGTRLAPYTAGRLPLVVTSESGTRTAEQLIYPLIDPTRFAAEEERFFAETIRDLDQRALQGGGYVLLRASGLLRQLFLDGSASLVTKANLKSRLRLQFTILDPEPRPPVQPDSHWSDIDPWGISGARTVVLGLDQFLAAQCLRVDGVKASVSDVIKACAHALGGVHLGHVNTPGQQAVVDWNKAVRVLGEGKAHVAIRGIARVALRGLHPLVQAMHSLQQQR
jgi:hypothetical protein